MERKRELGTMFGLSKIFALKQHIFYKKSAQSLDSFYQEHSGEISNIRWVVLLNNLCEPRDLIMWTLLFYKWETEFRKAIQLAQDERQIPIFNLQGNLPSCSSLHHLSPFLTHNISRHSQAYSSKNILTYHSHHTTQHVLLFLHKIALSTLTSPILCQALSLPFSRET